MGRRRASVGRSGELVKIMGIENLDSDFKTCLIVKEFVEPIVFDQPITVELKRGNETIISIIVTPHALDGKIYGIGLR